MKYCYALRHVPFESLGLLEPVLRAQGFEVRLIDVPISALDQNALRQAELVIVLGGPVSAYDEQLYPWLSAELDIVAWRLKNHQPTLGICLGAQLMARALGARVYPGLRKEVGWAPIQLTASGKTSPLSLLDAHPVLHWHGDTFDLPKDAELLAYTELTPHQAFSWGAHAVALQFHLEVTAQELEAWYVGHAVELATCGDQNIPRLREAGRRHSTSLAPYATRALTRLIDGLVSPVIT